MHGGSGLGLANSRRLAAQMGDALRLDRSDETGSTFTFEFPLCEALSSTVAPSRTLAGRGALVVGLSPFGASFLGERLAAFGAQVERVEGGARAIEILGLGAAPSTLGHFDGWLVKPVRTSTLVSRLAGAPPAPGNAAREPSAAAPDGLGVLLAEDNEINALAASKQLERMGARVTRARDGAEAVDLATQAGLGGRGAFDLVLMDVRMPHVDGLEATRRIRACENAQGLSPVRIIAVTANAFNEDRRACRAAGVDDVLTKPLEKDALAAALRSIGAGARRG